MSSSIPSRKELFSRFEALKAKIIAPSLARTTKFFEEEFAKEKNGKSKKGGEPPQMETPEEILRFHERCHAETDFDKWCVEQFEDEYLPDRIEFAKKTTNFPWTKYRGVPGSFSDEGLDVHFVPEIMFAFLRFHEQGLGVVKQKDSSQSHIRSESKELSNDKREENFKKLMGEYYTPPTPPPTTPLGILKSLVRYIDLSNMVFNEISGYSTSGGLTKKCSKLNEWRINYGAALKPCIAAARQYIGETDLKPKGSRRRYSGDPVLCEETASHPFPNNVICDLITLISKMEDSADTLCRESYFECQSESDAEYYVAEKEKFREIEKNRARSLAKAKASIKILEQNPETPFENLTGLPTHEKPKEIFEEKNLGDRKDELEVYKAYIRVAQDYITCLEDPEKKHLEKFRQKYVEFDPEFLRKQEECPDDNVDDDLKEEFDPGMYPGYEYERPKHEAGRRWTRPVREPSPKVSHSRSKMSTPRPAKVTRARSKSSDSSDSRSD